MSKIVAIIQARIGSTRLPGKVLLGLEGRTVLEHVVNRVGESALVDDVVVATTASKKDLKIAGLCAKKKILVFRGSEDDVLDRFYQAAKSYCADHVVRITADCPIIDHKVIDEVLRLHLRKKSDYTSNVLKETFPDGEDVEVFKFKTLKKAWEAARLPSEREHVTPYIRKNPKLFKLSNLACRTDLSGKRWTLDEKDDYLFMKKVFNALFKKNNFFGIEEILELLRAHPEYETINRGIGRNEGYVKSLRADKRLCSIN
ncbi:MAG: glycosyltransferase family protein [Candidatus Omnitrophica bacterium]|nr:glycosyltransferase family protein [Candidatus Omnitrophota bacterium]MDD5437311.1 glycosyltransferase family protein [Candidatus Omnitrophota bacterium]